MGNMYKKTGHEHGYTVLLTNYPKLSWLIDCYESFYDKGFVSIRLLLKYKNYFSR